MSTREINKRVDERLEELYQRHRPLYDDEIATFYTPELGYHKPDSLDEEYKRFGICLATTDGEIHCAGDQDVPFALQSISKVFVYGMALEAHGRDGVLNRVGVEPSGESFNSISLVFDESRNRPHNPMVNAGALATTDLVRGAYSEEALDHIVSILQRYAGSDDVRVDEPDFAMMMSRSDRNRAISYLMRSFDMIGRDVEENLALYLRQCAVRVRTQDLAIMAATLANGGENPETGDQVLTRRYVRDVLSVMHMCGMYDFAGEWAYRIGIPAKSGVGGGIMAVVPGKLGIGVYSPGLDVFGNSVRGIKVCEEISMRLGLHVFASETEDALLGPVVYG